MVNFSTQAFLQLAVKESQTIIGALKQNSAEQSRFQEVEAQLFGIDFDVDRWIKESQSHRARQDALFLSNWCSLTAKNDVYGFENIYRRLKKSDQDKMTRALMDLLDHLWPNDKKWADHMEKLRRRYGFSDRSEVMAGVYLWLHAHRDDPHCEKWVEKIRDWCVDNGYFWGIDPTHTSKQEAEILQALWSPLSHIQKEDFVEKHANGFLEPVAMKDIEWKDQNDPFGFKAYAKWVRLDESVAHLESLMRWHSFTNNGYGKVFMWGLSLMQEWANDPSHGSVNQAVLDAFGPTWEKLPKEFLEDVQKKPGVGRWIRNHFGLEVSKVLVEWDVGQAMKRLLWWEGDQGGNAFKLAEYESLFSFKTSSPTEQLIDIVSAWYLFNRRGHLNFLGGLLKWASVPLRPCTFPRFSEHRSSRGLGFRNPKKPELFHWFEELDAVYVHYRPEGSPKIKWGHAGHMDFVKLNDNWPLETKKIVDELLKNPHHEEWLVAPMYGVHSLKDSLVMASSASRIEAWISKHRQKQLEKTLSAVKSDGEGGGFIEALSEAKVLGRRL